MILGMKAGAKRSGDRSHTQGDPVGPPGVETERLMPMICMIAAGVDIERQADPEQTSPDQSLDLGLDKDQTWIVVEDQCLSRVMLCRIDLTK